MNKDLNTFVGKEKIGQSIPDRFEKIARQYPDRLAIKSQNRSLTYDVLNQFANRIARAILATRGEGSQPIALLFEHGIDVIAAILGTLKAGKFYVALDPAFPQERISYILEDSQAGLVITNNRNLDLAQKLTRDARALLNIDELDGSDDAFDNLGLKLTLDALANIRYTSGSTGQPKGVVQTHQHVWHNGVLLARERSISPDDRMSLVHFVGFGSASGDLFQSMLNGASLLPFDIKSEGVQRFSNWLDEERITLCHLPPALFRQLAALRSNQEKFHSVRLIYLSGAPVTQTDFELYKKTTSPETLLHIGMGSTEAGTIAAAIVDHAFVFPQEGSPAGYSRPGKKILLIDENGREVGPGRVGEIAVQGRNLNPGYWKRPDLTSAKFLPDPSGGDERIYLTGDLGRLLPDGFLIHLGRKDSMVKIRGYRVELAEVETALRRYPAVREAVVTAAQSKSGEARLVAYFTSSIQPAPSVSELRSFLREKLPDYMIPSAFVKLESIPLTSNGKVDRKALPEPEKTRPELDTTYIPPESEIDLKLVRIWEEVLDVHPIGIDDSFFDLGGHSLLAAKLFARLDEALGRSLPLGVLFSAPTIRLLAERYQSTPGQKARSAIVPIWTSGTLPPVFAVPGVFGNVLCFAELSRELGSDQPFYGLQSIGLDGAEAPLDSIESMASLYVSEIRKVQSHGPYALIGACFGARVAYEMARQVLEAEEPVAFLGLLDPSRREGYDTSENPKSRMRKRAKALSSFVTDRLRLYRDEMRGLDGAGRIKFITNKIRALTSNIGNTKAFTHIERELHQLEVFMANKEASKRYHRKRLNEGLRALEIFGTSRNTTGWRFDWNSLWGGQPVRHQVPGKDSGDMLRGENAPAVAGLLAERLRAAFGEKSRQDSIVHGR